MESTSPKPFVFVLMPFSDQFSDVYELGIKQVCVDAGANCERVDEQIFSESILEQVYSQIVKADIIIAEMTGRNANVFYEVGYAHALKKQVIFLTQKVDDIPFDLKHYPHIAYSGMVTDLKPKLEKTVEQYVANFISRLSNYNIEFYVDNVPLTEEPNIEIKEFTEWTCTNMITDDKFTLQFLFHNISTTTIDSSTCSLYLSYNSNMFVVESPIISRYVPLPDGNLLTQLELTKPLFPDEWESVKVQFTMLSNLTMSIKVNVLLKLHTHTGSKGYPFSLFIPVPDRLATIERAV